MADKMTNDPKRNGTGRRWETSSRALRRRTGSGMESAVGGGVEAAQDKAPAAFKALARYLALASMAFSVGCSTIEEKKAEPAGAIPSGSESTPSDLVPLQLLGSLEEKATVDNYVAHALVNNPGLKSAFARWRAAAEKVPQARSLMDPSLRYNYAIETGGGPPSHRVELMQEFPFFGKLGLREKMALAEAWGAKAAYEQERLSLIRRVKEAYYEYYYLGRAIRVTEQNIELLKLMEEVASTKFRAGEAQQDVLKAQVELEKMRNELRSLENMRGAVAAKLNAELNRPIDTPLPWPEEVGQQNLKYPEEQILELAKTASWELRAMSFEVEKNQKMLALARREFWPDFGLGVAYMRNRMGAGGMMVSEEGEEAVEAMVSVNLPVWRKRLYAQVGEAKASLTAAIEAKQQKENALLSEIRFALYKYNDAVRQIRLYAETLIPKAEQALSASQAGYRAGHVDFVNVIDSERELLTFRLAYEEALAGHQQRIAELEMMVGQPLAEPTDRSQKSSPGEGPSEPALPVTEPR